MENARVETIEKFHTRISYAIVKASTRNTERKLDRLQRMSMNLIIEPYLDQVARWPKEGKH